jgi:hypothetical protein
MKILKRLLLALVVVLIVIQFFHPAKNQSTEVLPTDISKVYGPIPADVNSILGKACNDCHSNSTVYPWYNNIQPVAWWLNNHIEEGKRHLNFSDFGSRRIGRQYKSMQDCIDEVKEGDMPLDSYLWIHKNAKLTDEEKQKLYAWFNTIRDTIKAKYPADSLIVPKRPQRPQ